MYRCVLGAQEELKAILQIQIQILGRPSRGRTSLARLVH